MLDNEFLKQMIPKRRATLDTASQRYDEIKDKLENCANSAQTKVKEIEKTKAWAAAFDVASLETKRMVLARLIENVEVKRGYKIKVRFKIPTQSKFRQRPIPSGAGGRELKIERKQAFAKVGKLRGEFPKDRPGATLEILPKRLFEFLR